MTDKPALRRYRARNGIALAAYMAILLPAAWARHSHVLPPGPWGWVIPGLAAVPLLIVIWSNLAYLEEEEDEYLRMLRVRTWVVATGLTLAVTTVWGLVQAFHATGPVELWWVIVLHSFFQGPANIWVRWRAAR